MGTVRPWNKARHAIVQAAFAVDFAAHPTPQTIRELLALHSKLEEAYPRRKETKGRLIGIKAEAFETEELRPQVGEVTLSGFTFDSLRRNGEVERSITLNGNKLSITRADYVKWEKTWEEVREVFALMLPVLLQRSDAIGFQLQYHNRFVWEGERSDFQAAQIFRKGSPFLAPNVFEVPELWHSFHGYFEYPDQPHRHQLLNVVEVQLVPSENVGLEPNVGLVAEVKLSHKTSHGVERAGGRATSMKTVENVLGAGDPGLLDAYMKEMHEKVRWLLARLIDDEMCDKVELDRPERV
jgi:uncharacterized protein (TIGR04255 family)